ncbi:MAG: S1C family serine protease [Acidobacteriota bacterium]
MRKSILAGVAAVAFFTIGFFTAQLLHPLPGGRTISHAESKTTGTVAQVAKQLSSSIVGVVGYGEEGDFFTRRQVQKTGSGVIIDPNGYIVTNNHVVSGTTRLTVVLANGKEVRAHLVGGDKRTDLALLKVTGMRLKPAPLGNSDQLVTGQNVVAIGNPLGLRFARSVTAGVVSGLNRLLTTEEGFVLRLIQTDAAINPGNSGGALVNLDGEVIGINTIKIAVQGFEGMGFAIPSNQVKTVIAEIRDHGRVVRPVAGLKIVNEVSTEEARFYNLPVNAGIAIVADKDGSAYKAGLRDYDIIQSVNGHEVKSAYELQDCMFRCKVGDKVNVKAIRLARRQGDTPKAMKFTIKLDGEK